jgi:hypothetical protein
LRAEGFSCSLGVLYEGLGISKWQVLIKKIKIKFPAVNFFKVLVLKPWIRTRDPESGSAIRKNAGSGSALNRCGSETLDNILERIAYFIIRLAGIYPSSKYGTVRCD